MRRSSKRVFREGEYVRIPQDIAGIIYENESLKGRETRGMLIRRLSPGEKVKKLWGPRRPGEQIVVTGDRVWLILIPGAGTYPISESAFEKIEEESNDADARVLV